MYLRQYCVQSYIITEGSKAHAPNKSMYSAQVVSSAGDQVDCRVYTTWTNFIDMSLKNTCPNDPKSYFGASLYADDDPVTNDTKETFITAGWNAFCTYVSAF